MRQFAVSVCFTLTLALALAGCTSGSSSSSTGNNPPPAGSVPLSISIHDTPPAGVTVLRFRVLITAATLQPAMAGQQPVNMLLNPQDVELIHLQSESALLANLNVPTGTYNGLSAMFANPEMTILNQSTTTYTVGAQVCQPGETCTVVPTLNNATISVTKSPFPITLSANTPVALDMHFDVNASVQGDLSVTPTVALTQVQAPGGEMMHTHLIGLVTAVTSPTFTLLTGLNGQSSVITTDSNTIYDFDQACPAENFSCIMTGQVLRVKATAMSGGVLEATRVKLLQQQGHPAFMGTITAVMAAQNQFQIVLGDRECEHEGECASAIAGLSITVNLSSGATFTIDSDGLTLPSGVSFASAADLMVGQTVEFQPMPPFTVTGTPPNVQISINATGVQLEPSQVTATVSAVNASATPPNFVLGTLPPLFTGAMISMIQVDAVMGTEFENVSGVGGLSTGQKVSVSGLLFNTATQPTLVAEEVKVRAPEGDD